MKIRIAAGLAASVIGLSACDGLKEALTAHVDVAARAGDQELSVTRLSDMLGSATLQIPVNRETAGIITDLWMNYELLGAAGARGDSLTDAKLMNQASLGMTSNMRL